MKQARYGLLLLIVLALPPVARLMESIMIIHMHMQMPLLVFAGFLMGKAVQLYFPKFLEKYNDNGLPGILLFSLIAVYWMLPRTMDESLTLLGMEIFKFISLPFLAGIPLRDSWFKISSSIKNLVLIGFAILFMGAGWLYIYSPVQLCNNYLMIEQITLGWGFVLTAICMVIYMLYAAFTERS